MKSMGISVVSMIASFVIFLGFSALRSVAKYVFVLLIGRMLLTGETVSMFNNPNVNMNSVVIMFIGWIVVSYIASHLVFTKKDILI